MINNQPKRLYSYKPNDYVKNERYIKIPLRFLTLHTASPSILFVFFGQIDKFRQYSTNFIKKYF